MTHYYATRSKLLLRKPYSATDVVRQRAGARAQCAVLLMLTQLAAIAAAKVLAITLYPWSLG